MKLWQQIHQHTRLLYQPILVPLGVHMGSQTFRHCTFPLIHPIAEPMLTEDSFDATNVMALLPC